MRPLAVLLLTVAAFVVAPPAVSLAEHGAAEPGEQGAAPPVDGYVPVGQGDKATMLRTQLEYPANRPATGVPTLLIYQGYTHKLGGYVAIEPGSDPPKKPVLIIVDRRLLLRWW